MKAQWRVVENDDVANMKIVPAAKTRAGDIRAIKAAVGWNGVRCRVVEDLGTHLVLKPRSGGGHNKIVAVYEKIRV